MARGVCTASGRGEEPGPRGSRDRCGVDNFAMPDDPFPAERAPELSEQRWQTEGIVPLERPGVLTGLFLRIVAFVERQNLKWAKLGNPCVYDTATFPWAADVEREWRAVRDELIGVLSRKTELPNVQD